MRMTNPAGNPMDAVATLMLERQRFEAWLAQLESRRAITPPHVFERVRADYEKRLREVTEQLTSRTSEVQATMAALTERLARLQSDETALRDERYEAELRSHVGEMTAAEWDKLQRDSDDRIARIGTERTTVTGEIARLQQLLSMSRDRAALSPDAGAAREGEKAAPAKGGPGFDELEFLKSVTDGSRTGAGGGSSAAPPRMPTPAPADAVRTTGAVPRSPTPASAPATAPSSAPVSSPGFGGSGAGDSRNDPKPAEPAKEPEQVPSFLRDVPQEATKTLKCGDCGAMNFPTEWYCERCGSELAGM